MTAFRWAPFLLHVNSSIKDSEKGCRDPGCVLICNRTRPLSLPILFLRAVTLVPKRTTSGRKDSLWLKISQVLLIPLNESKDHYPHSLAKLYFLSDRTISLKWSLRKQHWTWKKWGLYSPKNCTVSKNKKNYMEFPMFFFLLHRNLAEYLKTVWQNILPCQGIGWVIGCGICQIPDNGSRPDQIQVLQKSGMNLCWRCNKIYFNLKREWGWFLGSVWVPWASAQLVKGCGRGASILHGE